MVTMLWNHETVLGLFSIHPPASTAAAATSVGNLRDLGRGEMLLWGAGAAVVELHPSVRCVCLSVCLSVGRSVGRSEQRQRWTPRALSLQYDKGCMFPTAVLYDGLYQHLDT
jgi:hypothetical protein